MEGTKFWVLLLSAPSGARESVVLLDHLPDAEEINGYCAPGVECDGLLAAEHVEGLSIDVLPLHRNLAHH